MSKMPSRLLPSRPVHQGRKWGIRSYLLVFFCILLLLSNVFNGWSVTPAHAATRPNPNPPLSTPSWLHTPQAVKTPDLKRPAYGNQNASTISIPRPHPKMPPPLTVPLTIGAQQVYTPDGAFELDIAAGSVSAAQIQAAGGTISLKVVQLEAGSGGDVSGRIFLGTYQVQLLNAQGQPLTTLVLVHPFTFRYHAPKALQGWLWQDQRVYAIWQSSAPTQASTKSALVPQQTSPTSHLLLAQKETPTAAVWSVTTNLGTAPQTSHASSATPVPGVTPAASTSTITFNTEAPTASWGKAKDVDVGLSSGSLNDTYPVSVPPGPGGLTPPLSLSYSSGSVNESHNVQAPAPWVGEGWNMALGSVSWSQQNVTEDSGTATWENVWNINDPNGLSGQLIPPDQKASTVATSLVPPMSSLPAQYIWHTAPESHAKVQEVNFGGSPCWHVWLPSGTMEEFGCTNEARQSAKDALGVFTAYRWDLDLIVDRYGNQVRVHYKQNYPAGGNVRDAVISSVEYDDPSCHNTSFTNATAQCASWHPQVTIVFDSAMKVANQTNTTSCTTWTSTTFRCDDPVDLSSSSGLPIANAQSTYVLNDIKVQVNGHLLREYQLSYDQSGPQTIIDPYSGQGESAAGYLNLTKIEQLDSNGNLLNAPVTTMSYTIQPQHYVDKNHQANTKSTCPSWVFSSGSGCALWEQTYNSYYLTTLDNGMGWNVTMTWKEAHNNTHGTLGNDPFTCDAAGAQTPTSLCGEADDQNWSRIVLFQRVELTNGVSSKWSYQYYLNGFSAQPCSDCLQGDTWGNQNDDDYSDYYNGQFTSFASAQVTNPDTSSQTEYFASTPGWGLANSTITCYTTSPCHAAPYWNEDPGASGKLKTEEDFGTDGKLLQVTNNTYTMNCPPTGVAGSQNAAGGTVDPGGSYLFSQLDHNNPVVVCDPRVTQTDSYKVDGVTDVNGYLNDARVVHTTVNTTYDGDNQGIGAAYDYGNVSQVDTTSNDVGGLHFVQASTYYPNDNLGSNIYLTNLPAVAKSLDGSGTSYGCSASIYGANTSASQAPSVPSVTQQVGYVQQHAGCTSSAITTQHTYDSSGNSITGTDADGHLGCTLSGNTTQYSACATYDGFGTHLTRALNAKNQATTSLYNTALASTGYGQWLMGTTNANGQTTTYSYDTLGRLTSIVQPGDTQANPTTSYTYINTCTPGATAPCLELDTTTRVTSGSNTATTTKQWYDGMGRLVETQSPGPNQFSKVPAIGSLLVTYTVYDSMGRAITQSLPYAIAASATLHYAIPDLNQARTVSTFDGMGRPLGSVSYGIGVAILSESTINYTVGQGLPSFTVDTSTPFEQTITLDAYNHQQVEYTDALGRDRYDQVFSGTASPYTVVRTVQTNQDEVGNVTSTVTFDANSKALATRSTNYDGLKRVTGWNDSDQGSCANTPLPTSCSSSSDTAWKVTYDADGNQLSQTDPRNVTTYTSYDLLDRQLCLGTASSQVNPCQSSAYATFFYDSYDNSSNSGVTFPAGCVAPSGTSAPVGQKVAETFSNAAGKGWRCTGYDARGQTTAGALSVTADGQTTTQNVSMTYNDLGAINSLTYPDGETVTSQYDSNGRLRSAYFGTSSSSDPVAFLSGQVSYINSGQLAGLAVGGTANKTSVPTSIFSTSLGYDGTQRPVSSSATRTGASSPFWSQQRTFDNAGNILQLSTTLPTVSGASSKTDNQVFCYDALDRLTWAGNTGTPSGGDHCGSTPTGSTTSGYSQSFSYDALDRITSGSAGTESYSDPSHTHAATRLSSVTNPYASYDTMGNMTCRNVSSSSSQSCASATQTGATMSYDNEGRLSSWTAPKGSTSTDQFLYDNEGNRVLQRSSTSSVTDTITFDGYSEVVISGGTSTITNYFSVAGQRVAMRKGAILSYLLPDFLGSSSVALNNDGSIQAVQLYAPYGSVRYTDQVMPTDYNFTGQRLDAQTGLLYYNARYYDPVSGRFTSSDTVQNNTKGMDSYAYVGDNPVVRTDPSGKCWPLCTMLIGAAIGAVVGVASTVVTGAITGKMPSGGQIAQAAVTGAVAGAITGLAGPEAGPLARIAAGAVANAAGQAVGNAMQGKPVMDGVGQAAITGALTGGVMEGAGALAGKIGGEVEGGASSVLEGSCSFTPTTPVTTDHGGQSIGTLKVGEKVLAYNPKTKKMELQPILHVWITQDNDLVNLTLTTHAGHGSAAKLVSEVIHTNKKHPFLTIEKGFLPVGQIKLGMHVVEADRQVGVITGWVLVPGVMTMYNLTVAHDHTFTVGDGQWVVHNVCPTDQMEFQREMLQSRLIRKDSGAFTRSISSLENADTGEIVSEGISNTRRSDPIFGEVQCSEGNCLISAYQRDQLTPGSTYNMYTTQWSGQPACDAFCGGPNGDLQVAADTFNITINAITDDVNGVIRSPDIYTPSPSEGNIHIS